MPIFDQNTGKRIARHQTRSPHPVQMRRRYEAHLLTDLNGASITTGGTYTYGGVVDVSEYGTLILELVSTSLVLGSGAGLQASFEILSPKNATWMRRPIDPTFTANPTAAVTPVAGTGTIAAFIIPRPFGGMVRVGLTCTTAFTSGQIGALLHLGG